MREYSSIIHPIICGLVYISGPGYLSSAPIPKKCAHIPREVLLSHAGKVLWIHFNPAFRATKRNTNHGAFERHPKRKRGNLGDPPADENECRLCTVRALLIARDTRGNSLFSRCPFSPELQPRVLCGCFRSSNAFSSSASTFAAFSNCFIDCPNVSIIGPVPVLSPPQAVPRITSAGYEAGHRENFCWQGAPHRAHTYFIMRPFIPRRQADGGILAASNKRC